MPVCPSCCSCCGCCCPKHHVITVDRLNYDGSCDGRPNFQLYNLKAEYSEGYMVFDRFESGDRRVVAFIPPVECCVMEMQRVCSMDENVSIIVPEAEHLAAIESACGGGVSAVSVFEGCPTACLVFKKRNGRTMLRITLENAHDPFLQCIPAGTELRWLDGTDAAVWWRTKSSWGQSMASVFSS